MTYDVIYLVSRTSERLTYSLRARARVCVCMYIYICIYIFIYTHTPTHTQLYMSYVCVCVCVSNSVSRYSRDNILFPDHGIFAIPRQQLLFPCLAFPAITEPALTPLSPNLGVISGLFFITAADDQRPISRRFPIIIRRINRLLVGEIEKLLRLIVF